MDFQTVQSEKASAMARFNRLRTIATFWRFFEAIIAFFVLLWSPSVARLAGKSIAKMCNYAYTPLFSFFVFNLIIAVLVVLSRRKNGEEEEERERERERETVPGFVVFDESDFQIPLPEDLKMVVFSEIGEKNDADVAAEEDRKIGFFNSSEINGKNIDFPSAEVDQKMVFFPEIGDKKIDFSVAEEDRKMLFFPKIGEKKLNFSVAEKDRKMLFISEIGEKKIDFSVAEEDRKMLFFPQIGEKIIDFSLAEENRKMFFPEIGEKKIDFPVTEVYRKMLFFEEIRGKKNDFPEITRKKIDFPVVAEKDRKMVVYSEKGGKIDFPATLPPCVAAAEAAIEAARRRIRKFERSQSAKLRRDMETGLPRQQLIRRPETETEVPRQQRQLRRSETERAISVIEKVDNLSSEEFRRTIDEFIAKQKKAEKQLLII